MVIQDNALTAGLGSKLKSLLSRQFFPPSSTRQSLQGTSHSCRDRAIGRSKGGRDRKTSVLSQAEGHQGVALEFLHHSWAVPEVAFPDPAGPSLLGINMEEPRSRRGGESLVKRRTLGIQGPHTLSMRSGCNSLGQLQVSVSSPRKWVWTRRFHPRSPRTGVQKNRESSPRTCPGDSALPPLTSLRWGQIVL